MKKAVCSAWTSPEISGVAAQVLVVAASVAVVMAMAGGPGRASCFRETQAPGQLMSVVSR